MKFAITLSTVLAIGMISRANAGPPLGTAPGTQSDGHAVALPTQGSAPAAAAATATPAEEDADVGDDTLYRAPTRETLGSGAMISGEGSLHFKPRGKEKTQEVDSLKNLHSSGSDPKFKGSLLNSGVPSIENISNKGKQDAEAGDEVDDQTAEARNATDDVDPRFKKTKRLTFVRETKNDQKKTESDSTPSPTPSPTASPTAKDSGASKK